MYESYFGLQGQPFALNPDPAFYFNSRGHGRALAYLQYGVTQAEGFIVITGEIGAGKTTLLRMLLEGLDRQKVLPAQIVSTQLESGELLQAIITAFGIPSSGSSKAHLIATLEAFLTALAAQGRHALLIVDEAQNLDARAVEELRMLSNFQLGNKALLQSFLVGQPELRRILESPSMEQLRQRVTASYHLGPLGFEEVQAYVEHRMKHVGWTGRPAFELSAYDSLYRWTAGVPRRLNRLCNRVLLAAFLDGRDTLDGALVERTAEELRQEIGESDFEPVPVPARAAQPPAPVVEPVVDPAPTVPAPAANAPGPTAASEAVTEPVPLSDTGLAPLLPEVAPESLATEELDTLAATLDDLPPTPGPELLDDVDALLQASARQLDAIEAQVREDSGLDLEALQARVLQPSRDTPVPVRPVEQVEKPGRPTRGELLFCLGDTQRAALQYAALARGLSQPGTAAPRLVLLNPGQRAMVWPWVEMERLLPALDGGLHLGLPVTEPLERVLPTLFERVGRAVEALQPRAMLVQGDSDAVLATALCARRLGLPLLRLDAGRETAAREPAVLLNRSLLDTLCTRPAPPPGELRVDALAAVWAEVSSLRGALMRLGLPFDLDPSWATQFGTTLPYGLVTQQFDVHDGHALVASITRLLALPPAGKLVWLMDRAGVQALRMRLAEHADLAARVVLVEGDGPRSPQQREQIEHARILCRECDSLPDQLSMLRGASWALLDPGQVLVDAAELLGVPTLLNGTAGRIIVLQDGSVFTAEQREALAGWFAGLDPTPQRDGLPPRGGAVAALQAALRAWLAPDDETDAVVEAGVELEAALADAREPSPVAVHHGRQRPGRRRR